MPYVKRKIKIHRNGGDQFHVYDARILRQLTLISTHWWIRVRQADGEYYAPELFLVTKEYGRVGHDRIQTGRRVIPNLIDVALNLYGLEETVVAREVDKLYFDIDRHDDERTTLYITPSHYELLGQERAPMPTRPGKPKERVRRRGGRLVKIASLDKHRERVRRRRAYQIPEEKRVDQHLIVVDRLREQLLNKDLPALGSYQDIDVYTHYQDKDFFFEVKTGQNIKKKARSAIGQLLEYMFLYRHRVPDPHLCIVIDQKPDNHLIDFLEYVGIGLCWTAQSDFDCAPFCHDDLSFLLE